MLRMDKPVTCTCYAEHCMQNSSGWIKYLNQNGINKVLHFVFKLSVHRTLETLISIAW